MRATLGKNKATRPGEKVLVGCSGGSSSSCLVSLLQDATKATSKKILFLPSVLYIEEGAVINLPQQQRLERLKRARETLTGYGFMVYVCHFPGALSGLDRRNPGV